MNILYHFKYPEKKKKAKKRYILCFKYIHISKILLFSFANVESDKYHSQKTIQFQI